MLDYVGFEDVVNYVVLERFRGVGCVSVVGVDLEEFYFEVIVFYGDEFGFLNWS